MALAPAVYRRRLEAMRKRLGSVPADGLFATPSSNLFYLTGINFWRSERLTALFLFADQDPFAKAANLFPGGKATLAIEPSTAYDDVERLIARKPGWKTVSGGGLFASVRMVKTPEEIEAMRRAIAVALPRFRRAFEALIPGATEAEISKRFGGENVVQFGPSSALPHGASTERALARNQAVLIDAWDKPEGYYYDITRSTWFGEPSEEYRRVWNVVL